MLQNCYTFPRSLIWHHVSFMYMYIYKNYHVKVLKRRRKCFLKLLWDSHPRSLRERQQCYPTDHDRHTFRTTLFLEGQDLLLHTLIWADYYYFASLWLVTLENKTPSIFRMNKIWHQIFSSLLFAFLDIYRDVTNPMHYPKVKSNFYS